MIVSAYFIDMWPKNIANTPHVPFDISLHKVCKRRAEALPEHAHDHAQLTYVASGMAQLRSASGIWLLPPQLAAWVPSGVRHSIDIMTDAELWIMLWDPRAIKAWRPEGFPAQSFVSGMSPLLRNLLDALSPVDLASERGEIMCRLVLHELSVIKQAPTYLPMPESELECGWPKLPLRTIAMNCRLKFWHRVPRRRSVQRAGASRRKPG